MDKRRSKLIVFLAAVCCGVVLGACSGGKTDKAGAGRAEKQAKADEIDTALRSRLAEFAAAPRTSGKFGLYVYDLTAEKPVYGCKENEVQPSASCMKLLSGVAGLHLLGCNYKYSNAVYMRGRVTPGGKLMGDLAFVVGLDPQLEAVDIAKLSAAVRQKGIKSIVGRLIVNTTVREPVKSEQHWYPWDLSFSKYGLPYKGAPLVVKTVKSSLRAQGVALADSQVVAGRMPRGARLLAKTERPIIDVIQRMWKNSSNTQATAMLYTIGNRVNPDESPEVAGVAYLRKFLRDEVGEKNPAISIHDGCGLCVYNKLSPKSLVEILRYGYRDKDIRPVLNSCLAIAGVDGTLARAMANPKIRGKVRAKTGTLSHPYGISSLAGFCQASNGHTLAFAIMDCEMSVLDARVLQRRLAEAMVK